MNETEKTIDEIKNIISIIFSSGMQFQAGDFNNDWSKKKKEHAIKAILTKQLELIERVRVGLPKAVEVPSERSRGFISAATWNDYRELTLISLSKIKEEIEKELKKL